MSKHFVQRHTFRASDFWIVVSIILGPGILAGACTASRVGQSGPGETIALAQQSRFDDSPISRSLFTDKNATISEENIGKILDGRLKLPARLRIVVVKLDNQQRRWYLWNDEKYIKNQQAYVDQLSGRLKKLSKVEKVSVVPEMIISAEPTMTSIREAAVRMQADGIVIFATTSDIYSKYRFLSKTDIKAFATTQLLYVNTRTGLIPFTGIVTRDFLSQKNEADLDLTETRMRVQDEAVRLTISELGDKLTEYLSSNQ